MAPKKKSGRGGKRRGAGRPSLGMRTVRLTLDDDTVTKGTAIGEGNLSRGVRIAVKEHKHPKRKNNGLLRKN